ncbi:hypothetical protein JKP88DRAFT_242479 [Tribonema minus]|uniref:Uncharacterized protein n=1 Tax=Tribonema minus TaxID=303371 RepID=A0A836C845_9STRA|nr:hypothetical protein JKP88DRAFT_242479 [Tribonema minus]
MPLTLLRRVLVCDAAPAAPPQAYGSGDFQGQRTRARAPGTLLYDGGRRRRSVARVATAVAPARAARVWQPHHCCGGGSSAPPQHMALQQQLGTHTPPLTSVRATCSRLPTTPPSMGPLPCTQAAALQRRLQQRRRLLGGDLGDDGNGYDGGGRGGQLPPAPAPMTPLNGSNGGGGRGSGGGGGDRASPRR